MGNGEQGIGKGEWGNGESGNRGIGESGNRGNGESGIGNRDEGKGIGMRVRESG